MDKGPRAKGENALIGDSRATRESPTVLTRSGRTTFWRERIGCRAGRGGEAGGSAGGKPVGARARKARPRGEATTGDGFPTTDGTRFEKNSKLRSPSGVVEVLEVPEEAGLFLRVAGRILFQHAGHWPAGLARTCACRTWTKVWRRTTARPSRWRLWARRGPGVTRALCTTHRPACSSAPDVRERFTSSTASMHRYHRRRRRRRRRPLSTTRRIRDGRAHPARRRSAAVAPQSGQRRAYRILSPGVRASRAAVAGRVWAKRRAENGTAFFYACNGAHDTLRRHDTHAQNGDTLGLHEQKINKIIKQTTRTRGRHPSRRRSRPGPARGEERGERRKRENKNKTH